MNLSSSFITSPSAYRHPCQPIIDATRTNGPLFGRRNPKELRDEIGFRTLHQRIGGTLLNDFPILDGHDRRSKRPHIPDIVGNDQRRNRGGLDVFGQNRSKVASGFDIKGGQRLIEEQAFGIDH